MLPLVLVGILLLSEYCLLPVAQEICTSPSIGSNIQSQFSINSPNIDRRYYLNIAEPAHCSGIISRVKYCYYGPSRYSSNLFWVAGVALYHSQADGSYGRVSAAITLSKHLPSNQRLPNSRTDLLLNFNCDTYVLNSFVRVQRGDVFGAVVFQDRQFPTTFSIRSIGGLDLIGDSSCGYQMLTRSADTLRISSISTDRGIQSLHVQMLDTLTGLSLDTEKRVLHVFADIIPDSPVIFPIKPSMKSTTCEKLITTAFIKPVPSPSRTTVMSVKSSTVIIPNRPSVKPTAYYYRASITTAAMINPYSTDSSWTTALSITTENTSHIHMHTTESSTRPHRENLQSWRKIVGGVLGSAVIILGCTVSMLGIVVVVIRRNKRRKATIFDLTTNEAYTGRTTCTQRLIDDHDHGDAEAIEYDVNKVPMELNAAYMVKSPIKATRNVAYENTSEFSEYDYVNAQ